MTIDRARSFMIDELNAITLAWEIPGPKDTSVQTIQCWNVPTEEGATRLVIVEIYDDGGFDVFPQINVNTFSGTAKAVRMMETIEKGCNE